jgi:hypothetical protein
MITSINCQLWQPIALQLREQVSSEMDNEELNVETESSLNEKHETIIETLKKKLIVIIETYCSRNRTLMQGCRSVALPFKSWILKMIDIFKNDFPIPPLNGRSDSIVRLFGLKKDIAWSAPRAHRAVPSHCLNCVFGPSS